MKFQRQKVNNDTEWNTYKTLLRLARSDLGFGAGFPQGWGKDAAETEALRQWCRLRFLPPHVTQALWTRYPCKLNIVMESLVITLSTCYRSIY